MSKPKRQPKAQAPRLFETATPERQSTPMPAGIPEPDRRSWLECLIEAYEQGLEMMPDGINRVTREAIIANLLGGYRILPSGSGEEVSLRGELAERIDRALQAAETRGKVRMGL